MMFVRRCGAEITANERRWLRGAFVASYLMLLASFETGGSADPLILSLGLPAKFTLPMRLAFGAAFLVFTLLGFQRLIREKGARSLVAPLTLAFTQFLWFVLPTLLELNSASQVPQTRYSSGILAVLHSAQYIWITSYYQRREARAAGQKSWHMAAYFATLIAGGIALFIPGPVAGQLFVSLRFHHQLPDFHGACEYSSLHSRRQAMETARFARFVAAGGSQRQSVSGAAVLGRRRFGASTFA